jgi:hypothetical protein
MIPNLYPADELARLRTDIRRLEAREQELRKGFLAGKLPLFGYESRVELRQSKRKVFLRERLGPEVLNDPKYWGERVTKTVLVVTPASTAANPRSTPPPRASPSGAAPALR